MAWEQLSINRPHLVYIILGGFTSLFMLCSSVIKERLYIGEATVATICGIIFGPHAANLIDPRTWGNVDQITLEFSRIVLVVQCFAVGVELPKAYMERHWKSVVLLLIPVMTFGWLITSLFIYWLIPSLNWLDSLVVAACVTATDPVLASSVVGKGKFAKRVPKHIRDLLSCESGCNDGMAFPFVYLGLYLIKYRPNAGEVIYHWVCFTILYECIFGAFYGFVIGYIARRAIRYAHEKNLIDRESFLVFYFVLALFCAGSGSMLGLDDLLVGFACGVGFSNDGWFTEKTEESHVSNVIDLLINLAFFVYFGTIIPWEQFNAEQILGLTAWRLVVVAILVLLFRRIPIMLVLKPIIPDMKTWREAFFSGHFGPIGVGAIFIAILARAELETDTTTPLTELPPEGFPHLNIIELIWPVTCFLVICSIVVHGSSIAVFTLGKHINTLTLTMSYTQANDSSWMERLPRIQTRSKSSMSLNRGDQYSSSFNEKLEAPAGVVPKNFLRRQREEDGANGRRRKDQGYGGPISQSAIAPMRSPGTDEKEIGLGRSDSDTLAMREGSPDTKVDSSSSRSDERRPGEEIYEEGNQTVYEDKDGNVLEVENEDPKLSERKRQEHEGAEADRLHEMESHGQHVGDAPKTTPAASEPKSDVHGWKKFSKGMHDFRQRGKSVSETPPEKRGPARAYQYGNTIIVEDEDGEVIKKYDINPPAAKKGEGSTTSANPHRTRQRMERMGSYLGVRPKDVEQAGTEADDGSEAKKGKGSLDDDDRIRFTVEAGGRRLSKAEFIQQIQQLDPKARARFVENSNVPETVKEEARADARDHDKAKDARKPSITVQAPSPQQQPSGSEEPGRAQVTRTATASSTAKGPENLTFTDENDQDIPFHDVSGDLAKYKFGGGSSSGETAAQRRRREAAERAALQEQDDDSEDDGTERVPPRIVPLKEKGRQASDNEEETAAERRRREGALGIRRGDEGSDSEDDAEAAKGIKVAGDATPPRGRKEAPLEPHQEESEEDEEPQKPTGIRFAEVKSPTREEGSSNGKRRPQRRFGGK
ncbi:Sodium/hydrogen exchanger family-domain-containing protein [Elsinoe ampelina]|uniref:Sodium/hydrogen exchanger family-domain-containing protein n=1 Tax=Elsinoe ampelina TaxID=302913 RepID=A0A6A6GKB1_9PEZI|nr:Sodium/hydrogen exchanger family-domain-containing protein [Elsinoe ampelina]